MENLGIDGKLLLAQVLNFGLFFYIFKRFIAKPFRRFIENERNSEVEREKSLVKIDKQEENMSNKIAEFKEEMKRETAKVIADAKVSAEKIKAQIIAEAEEDAKDISEKTKKQLVAQQEVMEKQLRAKILELSFFIIKDSLKDSLTDEYRKKITERILKNLPKKVLLYEN